MEKILIVGYGWSGSGAVLDYINDYEQVFCPNIEFSVFWEPRGLYDLKVSLIDNWDFLGHSIKIEDFLDYIRILSRDNNRYLFKRGEGYSKCLDIDLNSLANEYLQKLISFEYHSNSRIIEQRKTSSLRFYEFIKRKFKLYNPPTFKYAKVSEKLFISATQDFINKIFKNSMNKTKSSILLLDQAVSVTNLQKSLHFFESSKCIVVSRDPRDTYVDMVRNKSLMGVVDSLDSVEKFILWYSNLRKTASEEMKNLSHNICKKVSYEEFVLCENVRDEVSEFVSVEKKYRKNRKFIASESKANIGIWKDYHCQKSMEKIYSCLKKYCHDF